MGADGVPREQAELAETQPRAGTNTFPTHSGARFQMLLLLLCAAARGLSTPAGKSIVADGSGRLVGGWDKEALLRGYQNSAEQPAREVMSADLPADLIGTYYRNAPQRFTGYDGRKVRHPFDADGMVSAISLNGAKGKAVIRQRYVATEPWRSALLARLSSPDNSATRFRFGAAAPASRISRIRMCLRTRASCWRCGRAAARTCWTRSR